MGKKVNQVGGLQRPENNRWSSHFKSICSLIKIYGATYLVLENIILDRSTYSQRSDAIFSFKLLMSFDFAFLLHIIKNVMGYWCALPSLATKISRDFKCYAFGDYHKDFNLEIKRWWLGNSCRRSDIIL